jgi:hypothetical protein
MHLCFWWAFLDEEKKLEEIKGYLKKVTHEFESLFESAGGFEDSRIGNGWDPSQINESIYIVTPMPFEEAIRLIKMKKRKIFGLNLLKYFKSKSEEEFEIIGKPIIRFIPYWAVSGFYECFYFRGNSYRFYVQNDVIAVEVEGKVRNLLTEDHFFKKGISEGIKRTLQKLRRFSNEKPKYFIINDVTELARIYDECIVYLDMNGNEDKFIGNFLKENLPLKKISEINEFKIEGVEVQAIPPLESKEDIVKKVFQKIVKPPKVFKRILSNRFEITRLDLYYIPFYVFKCKHKGFIKEVSLHGITGEIFA